MRVSVLAPGLLVAASVLVDVLLAVVVTVAVLVAVDLGRRWVAPALRARQDRQDPQDDQPREPLAVPSWRPGSEPDALPAAPPSGSYGVRRVGQRFRQDPGRLL